MAKNKGTIVIPVEVEIDTDLVQEIANDAVLDGYGFGAEDFYDSVRKAAVESARELLKSGDFAVEINGAISANVRDGAIELITDALKYENLLADVMTKTQKKDIVKAALAGIDVDTIAEAVRDSVLRHIVNPS